MSLLAEIVPPRRPGAYSPERYSIDHISGFPHDHWEEVERLKYATGEFAHPVGVPFRGPSGHWFVQHPDGRIVPAKNPFAPPEGTKLPRAAPTPTGGAAKPATPGVPQPKMAHVSAMVGHVKALQALPGGISPAHKDDLILKLMNLDVFTLREIKKQLGIQASGHKAAFVKAIADRAVQMATGGGGPPAAAPPAMKPQTPPVAPVAPPKAAPTAPPPATGPPGAPQPPGGPVGANLGRVKDLEGMVASGKMTPQEAATKAFQRIAGYGNAAALAESVTGKKLSFTQSPWHALVDHFNAKVPAGGGAPAPPAGTAAPAQTAPLEDVLKGGPAPTTAPLAAPPAGPGAARPRPPVPATVNSVHSYINALKAAGPTAQDAQDLYAALMKLDVFSIRDVKAKFPGLRASGYKSDFAWAIAHRVLGFQPPARPGVVPPPNLAGLPGEPVTPPPPPAAAPPPAPPVGPGVGRNYLPLSGWHPHAAVANAALDDFEQGKATANETASRILGPLAHGARQQVFRAITGTTVPTGQRSQATLADFLQKHAPPSAKPPVASPAAPEAKPSWPAAAPVPKPMSGLKDISGINNALYVNGKLTEFKSGRASAHQTAAALALLPPNELAAVLSHLTGIAAHPSAEKSEIQNALFEHLKQFVTPAAGPAAATPPPVQAPGAAPTPGTPLVPYDASAWANVNSHGRQKADEAARSIQDIAGRFQNGSLAKDEVQAEVTKALQDLTGVYLEFKKAFGGVLGTPLEITLAERIEAMPAGAPPPAAAAPMPAPTPPGPPVRQAGPVTGEGQGVAFNNQRQPSVNSAKPVISFDFDGVLHNSVEPDPNNPGHNRPVGYRNWQGWAPNAAAHALVKQLSQAGHEVVVVTSRHAQSMPEIWAFIHQHNLPVSAVYATNNAPKGPVLNAVNAAAHYDDSPAVVSGLAGWGGQAIHVDPYSGGAAQAPGAAPGVAPGAPVVSTPPVGGPPTGTIPKPDLTAVTLSQAKLVASQIHTVLADPFYKGNPAMLKAHVQQWMAGLSKEALEQVAVAFGFTGTNPDHTRVLQHLLSAWSAATGVTVPAGPASPPAPLPPAGSVPVVTTPPVGGPPLVASPAAPESTAPPATLYDPSKLTDPFTEDIARKLAGLAGERRFVLASVAGPILRGLLPGDFDELASAFGFAGRASGADYGKAYDFILNKVAGAAAKPPVASPAAPEAKPSAPVAPPTSTAEAMAAEITVPAPTPPPPPPPPPPPTTRGQALGFTSAMAARLRGNQALSTAELSALPAHLNLLNKQQLINLSRAGGFAAFLYPRMLKSGMVSRIMRGAAQASAAAVGAPPAPANAPPPPPAPPTSADVLHRGANVITGTPAGTPGQYQPPPPRLLPAGPYQAGKGAAPGGMPPSIDHTVVGGFPGAPASLPPSVVPKSLTPGSSVLRQYDHAPSGYKVIASWTGNVPPAGQQAPYRIDVLDGTGTVVSTYASAAPRDEAYVEGRAVQTAHWLDKEVARLAAQKATPTHAAPIAQFAWEYANAAGLSPGAVPFKFDAAAAGDPRNRQATDAYLKGAFPRLIGARQHAPHGGMDTIEHTMNIINPANLRAAGLPARDADLLRLGMVFHDVGKQYNPLDHNHPRLSAKDAEPLLWQFGLTPREVSDTLAVIKWHDAYGDAMQAGSGPAETAKLAKRAYEYTDDSLPPAQRVQAAHRINDLLMRAWQSDVSTIPGLTADPVPGRPDIKVSGFLHVDSQGAAFRAKVAADIDATARADPTLKSVPSRKLPVKPANAPAGASRPNLVAAGRKWGELVQRDKDIPVGQPVPHGSTKEPPGEVYDEARANPDLNYARAFDMGYDGPTGNVLTVYHGIAGNFGVAGPGILSAGIHAGKSDDNAFGQGIYTVVNGASSIPSGYGGAGSVQLELHTGRTITHADLINKVLPLWRKANPAMAKKLAYSSVHAEETAAALWAGYSTIAVDYAHGNPTLVVLDPARIRVKNVVGSRHQGYKGLNVKAKQGTIQSKTLTADEIKTPRGHPDHVPVKNGVPQAWSGQARTS